eukprot:Tamp_23352.p1 GENE.Tamp_23352~~Tamp_23352.p1  ORF type:complete len:314 (+),score=48.28 Tamp_23352:68-943(+)
MPRAARNILVRRRFQQANMANMAAGRRAHVLILLPLVLSATLEASATSRGDCLPETRVAAPGSACAVQHEGAGGGGGGEGAQMLRSDSESVAQSEGWIDFMDVEEDNVVYPFSFRLSRADLLDADGQDGAVGSPCAVLVFVDDEIFQVFLSPYNTDFPGDMLESMPEIYSKRFETMLTFFNYLVDDKRGGLVGHVQGHLLAAGEYTFTLKIVHARSIQRDMASRSMWLVEEAEVELTGMESQPRDVHIHEPALWWAKNPQRRFHRTYAPAQYIKNSSDVVRDALQTFLQIS